jgi:hypothetical protein
VLLGLCSYVVGSLYIYNFPVQALKQLFTPGGSVLLTLGMLLLGCVALSSRVLRGWRAAAPLLTAFYFPLQFPLQAALFLGRGRGPNPVLLGAWGIFWLLLGYAIRSQARDRKATRRGPESGGADGRRGDPPDEQWAINQLIIN